MAVWKQGPEAEISSNGFAQGLVENVSPLVRRPGALSAGANLQYVDFPSLTTRPGLTRLGTAGLGAGRVLGLVALNTTAGVNKYVTGYGTSLYVYNAGTGVWDTLLTGLTSDQTFEGAVTDDEILVLTNLADSVRKYDGTTIGALGGSPPKAKYVACGFRRVFLGGLSTNKRLVQCSDVAAIETWTPASGNDAAALPVPFTRGDEITWLRFWRERLVVWGRYELFELYGPEQGLLSPSWRWLRVGGPGAVAGRTVREVKGLGLVWLADGAVVAWSGGSQPEDLTSGVIPDTMARINPAAQHLSVAWVDELGRYNLAVPVDGATQPNLVLHFDTRYGVWLPGWTGWTPTAAATLRVTGQDLPYLGDSLGNVWRVAGQDDAGAAIAYSLEYGPLVVASGSRQGALSRIHLRTSKAAGATMALAVSRMESGTYETGVTLTPATTFTHTRVAVPLPAGTNPVQDVLRVKVSGAGQVTLHDVTAVVRQLDK